MKKLRFKRATLNVLPNLRSATLMEDSFRVSDALVWKVPGELQPFFPERAKHNIAGMISAVLYYAKEEDKNLATVDQVLSHPVRRQKMAELMTKCTDYKGALAAMGASMLSESGDAKASVIGTETRYLGWIRTPIVMEATAKSSFDLSKIKKRKTLIGVVLPPEHAASGQGYLRSVINATIMACVIGQPDESRKVYYFFDEAAQLGSPPPQSVVDLLGAFRKYGARGIWVYQALGQLAKCWPEDRGEILLANTTKIFAGASDVSTSKLIESMLGKFTQVVESGGTNTGTGSNTGYSEGRDMSRSGGSNKSWGSSSNWQQAPRELLTADEIIRGHGLPPRWAITFVPGMAPVLTQMLRYWEEKWLGKRVGLLARFRQAVRTLLGSIVLLAVGVGLAMILMQMLEEQSKSKPQYQPAPKRAPAMRRYPEVRHVERGKKIGRRGLR